MEEDVFGFEVSVQNIVVVHVLNSVADLLDDAFNFLLREPALEFQILVEAAGRAELHEKVETGLVGEEGVQLDDVGVVQKTLDLYLPHSLGQHSRVVGEYCARDLLECAEEVRPFVPA